MSYVLEVDCKMKSNTRYKLGDAMQTRRDVNLQKQFEFAGGEFKLLSNSLNYKAVPNCLLAIHIRFA